MLSQDLHLLGLCHVPGRDFAEHFVYTAPLPHLWHHRVITYLLIYLLPCRQEPLFSPVSQAFIIMASGPLKELINVKEVSLTFVPLYCLSSSFKNELQLWGGAVQMEDSIVIIIL